MTDVQQPVTDNSLKIRQVTHFQFSWTAGEPGEEGTHTLQLVLDQGAWEEVLTVSPIEAFSLQFKLAAAPAVFYDLERRTLVFNTARTGAGFFLAAEAARS